MSGPSSLHDVRDANPATKDSNINIILTVFILWIIKLWIQIKWYLVYISLCIAKVWKILLNISLSQLFRWLSRFLGGTLIPPFYGITGYLSKYKESIAQSKQLTIWTLTTLSVSDHIAPESAMLHNWKISDWISVAYLFLISLVNNTCFFST